METDMKPAHQVEILDKHPVAVTIDADGLLTGIEDSFMIPVDKKRHLKELPGCGDNCRLQGQFKVESVGESQCGTIMFWMEFNGKKDQETHPAARIKVGEWIPLKDVHLNKWTSNKMDLMAFSPEPACAPGCSHQIQFVMKAKLM